MTDMIEDLLHILVDNILIADGVTAVNDLPILSSISRQCKKGIGLTDRQHALVKEKLINYVDEFSLHGIKDAKETIEQGHTRLPIRQIDRSKYITVVNHSDMLGPNSMYESYKENWHWIKVRFPFSKKTIVLVETLSSKHRQYYYHSKGSHEHYFRLHENVLYDVIDAFKDKSFTIDEDLIEKYNQIKSIKESSNLYIPGYYENQFANLSEHCVELVKSDLGDINANNYVQLYDRRFRYGLENIEKPSVGNLLGTIIHRELPQVSVDPNSYNIDRVAETVLNLDRFPLLVLIDKDESLDQMLKVYNSFSGFVPSEKQCALFRVENNGEYNINNFIQEKKLNNWLDNNTEIVYITKDKLPKLLLKEEWRPVTALALTSRYTNNYVSVYVNDYCDLIIYHDVDTGLFKRRHYEFM